MQLILFKYKEQDHLSDVRTVEIDGELWFVANDVCRVLGYKYPKDAVSRHCKPKGAMKHLLPTSGGMQETTLINEGNLYRLIVKSQLPSADAFETWIFEEVIPSIRKTGSYTALPMLNTYTERILSEPTKGVPDGHWSIFDESHSVMLLVESKIGSYSQFDLIDGSIGKRWSTFRKGKAWALASSQYPHEYVDIRGARMCKAYQDSELPYFRNWLKHEYKKKHLYDYLYNKYSGDKNTAILDKIRTVLPPLLSK
jgi:hypothetical protein